MRIPPATLRRNGQKMMTTTIEFHVGWSDVVTITACMLNNQRGVNTAEQEPINRTTVWTTLRDELAQRGYNMWAMSDDVNEETQERAIELCTELFPELVYVPSHATGPTHVA